MIRGPLATPDTDPAPASLATAQQLHGGGDGSVAMTISSVVYGGLFGLSLMLEGLGPAREGRFRIRIMLLIVIGML